MAPSSQQLRSKAIYTLSGLLKHNAAAIALFEAAGGWDALRDAFSGKKKPLITHLVHPLMLNPSQNFPPLSDSDIRVRRKAAFLLNTLLTPSTPTSAATNAGTRIHSDGPPQAGEEGGGEAPAVVHPNSHASMVADPALVDTATETLRALRAHGLLPVILRELTEPTPYGPDGDEGDGCADADLEEKLLMCVFPRVR